MWKINKRTKIRIEKTGMDKRNTKAPQCSKNERNLLYRSRWRRVQTFFKNAKRNRKDLWSHPCSPKDHRALRKWLQSRKLHPRRTPKCKVVWWNFVNPRDNERSIRSPKTVKATLQVKDLHRCFIVPWYQSFPMSQVMKILDAQAAVDKEWKKLGTIPAPKRHKESPLCFTNGHMSPQKRWVGTKITEVSRQSRALERHCKRQLWKLCSVDWTGLVCVPEDCRKRIGYYCKIYQVVKDKQLMQYLITLTYNWKMLPDCSKFLKRNVQMFGYVFHDTNGPNF